MRMDMLDYLWQEAEMTRRKLLQPGQRAALSPVRFVGATGHGPDRDPHRHGRHGGNSNLGRAGSGLPRRAKQQPRNGWERLAAGFKKHVAS
jgi:hypothetical protein